VKKLILISLFLIGLAGLAGAAPIFCSVLMGSNTSGNSSSTCAITPDPGFFISSLTLTATDDYTGLQSGSPVVTYGATINESAAVFTGITFCTVTTGGSGSVPCSDTILPANTVTGLNLSNFSLNLINATNSVTGGSVTGASIVLTLDYAETQITTPEPATLGITSVFLIGLGLFGWRKKQRLVAASR